MVDVNVEREAFCGMREMDLVTIIVRRDVMYIPTSC